MFIRCPFPKPPCNSHRQSLVQKSHLSPLAKGNFSQKAGAEIRATRRSFRLFPKAPPPTFHGIKVGEFRGRNHLPTQGIRGWVFGAFGSWFRRVLQRLRGEAAGSSGAPSVRLVLGIQWYLGGPMPIQYGRRPRPAPQQRLSLLPTSILP